MSREGMPALQPEVQEVQPDQFSDEQYERFASIGLTPEDAHITVERTQKDGTVDVRTLGSLLCEQPEKCPFDIYEMFETQHRLDPAAGKQMALMALKVMGSRISDAPRLSIESLNSKKK